MYKDSNLTQAVLTEICTLLVKLSEPFALVWKQWGGKDLIRALLRRVMQRAHVDPSFGEVPFLMCFRGCCLVVDPNNPSGCTAIQISCPRGGDIPEPSCYLHLGWQCPHCEEKRMKVFRYWSVAAKFRAMWSDPKHHLLFSTYAATMRKALKRVYDALDAGLGFTDLEFDEFSDICDGSNFFGVVKELRARGITLNEFDQLIGMNYDGVELVKRISTWPLLFMLYGLGPLYRHEKPNLHVGGFAGGSNSPVDLISFLWPFVLEMRAIIKGVKVRDPGPTGMTRTVRIISIVTCQDLMALLKTTGLAVVSGKCCCPCCWLPGERAGGRGSTHYMPLSALPGKLQDAMALCGVRESNDDTHVAIIRKYERDYAWLSENWHTLSMAAVSGHSKKSIAELSTAVGLKRATPFMAMPYLSGIPGGFYSFDAMHTLHHNAWKNIIAVVLEQLTPDAWRTLESRAEACAIPHVMSASYQRLSDPITGKRTFKTLKAADKAMMMYFFLPVLLYGLVPPSLYWALVAFTRATQILCRFKVSCADVDIVEGVYWNIFCVLDSFFPTSDMKVTLHLMLHAAEWVRKNGPLRCTWLYAFERYNADIVRAARSNRVPIASVINRFRIGQFVSSRLALATHKDHPSMFAHSASDVVAEVQALMANTVSSKRWVYVSVPEDEHSAYVFDNKHAQYSNGRVAYGTLYNMSYDDLPADIANGSNVQGLSQLLQDRENSSAVYRSGVYYIGKSICPRGSGDFGLSCFAFIAWDNNGVSELSPAFISEYLVSGPNECSVVVRWLKVLPISDVSNRLPHGASATTPGYRACRDDFVTLPHADDTCLQQQARNPAACGAAVSNRKWTFSSFLGERNRYFPLFAEPGRDCCDVLPFTLVRLPCCVNDISTLLSSTPGHFSGADRERLPVSSIFCHAIASPFPVRGVGNELVYAITPIELRRER